MGVIMLHSIQGGFNTYITYAGADSETANFFERIIGRVRERQKREITDPTDQYREYNLMNSAEVRMIEENQALIVSGNRQAIKLNTTPYFKNWRFNRQAKKGSIAIENADESQTLQYVEL